MMINRKLDFKNFYIASVKHLPDADIQNLIIKLTWSDGCDFSYKVLNYDGDNHEVSYFYSEDASFEILEKIEDDGTTLLWSGNDYIVGQYYFVRVQHREERKLHTAVIRILKILYDGDILYTVASYPFENSYYKSNDFRFELIKFLQNAWL